jgi:hypothetical protein
MGDVKFTSGTAMNTDVELWREESPDGPGYAYYAPSIHRTQGGGIGINVAGTVFVKTLRQWHALAVAAQEKTAAKANETQEQTTAKPL